MVRFLNFAVFAAGLSGAAAFAPVQKATPWGIGANPAVESTVALQSSQDDNFDGVDLKKLLGVKQLKRMARKSRSSTSSSSAASDSTSGGFVADSPATDSSSSPVKIIIAGAPASGKGTQCEGIKEKYNVVHLSTGDMLRAAVAASTPVGVQAKEYMDSGKLVPDEVIIGVVRSRPVVAPSSVSDISAGERPVARK